jgi:selenocysteine-specific elongation factor
VDRVFSVAGRGTVVTGTLWSGSIARGDQLALLPGPRHVRVRGVQVHDAECALAQAGQRVAVNLSGVKAREIARGDVLAPAGSLRETAVLDCLLSLAGARHGARVQVHHGTRAVPARLAWLASCEGGDLWQVRLERPLLALAGDRLVVRAIAPSSTLGGGVVLDAHAARHGRRREILVRLAERSREAANGSYASLPSEAPAERAREQRSRTPARALVPEEALIALEARLREAGTALLSEAQLAAESAALRELCARGRAVRVSGRLYAHAEVADEVRGQVIELIERDGAVTLPGLRDELEISRKSAQAFLEQLDAAHVTRRLADNRRVLRRARGVVAGSRG